MSKEKFKRKIRRAAAAIAALALAVSFTFPAGTDMSGISFGNAIVASAATVASGTCGDYLTWTLDDAGKLTISYTGSGSGAMYDWNNPDTVPWYTSKESIKSVVIEQGVTSIGDFALNECSSLTSITIPNSVTSIGESAISFCTNLTSINIPDSVNSIGNFALDGCSSLTSVTIPDSVTSIGKCALGECSSLTSINVNEDNQNYCSVDGVLFNKDKTTLVAYPNGKGASYVFPDSVTSIGDYAFTGCTSLTSITIPDSVTSIGNFAFVVCTSLTSITIPDSVTSIGNYALNGCSSLTSVTIPNSVTSIGFGVFYKCTNLTSVTIPNSVTSIGGYAFWRCSSLTSITIPNSVTSIGDSAFESCSSLTSIFLPNSLNVTYAAITNWATKVKYTVSGNTVTITEVTPGRGQTSVAIPETIDGKTVTIGSGVDFGTLTQIKYTVADGKVTVTGVTLGSGQPPVSIPSAIDGKTVTAVFIENGTTVTAPDTATQVKYTVTDNKVTITEIIPGTGQTSADIPEKIGGYPVVSVAGAYQQYVGNHTHYFSNNICGLCSGAEYVTGITVSPDTLSFTVGDPASQLTAAVVPTNAVDTSVEWTSSDTSVAAVDDSGNVTAVGKGTATITATAKDGSGIYGECAVTVKATPNVTAPTASTAVDYGKTLADAGLTEGWTWENEDTVAQPANTYTAYKELTDDGIYDYNGLSGFTYDEENHKLSCEVPVIVNSVIPVITITASPDSAITGRETTVTVTVTAKNPNNDTLTDVPTPAISYKIGDGTEQAITGGSFVIPANTSNGTVVTITAKTSGSAQYNAKTDTKTITVADCTHPNVPAVTVWETDETYHWHKCPDCGAELDKAEHSSNAPATETSPEVCKDCGYEMSPALGHIHKNHLTYVDRVEPADCTTDGTEAHYKCDCGKLFADNQAATEVTLESLKIAAHHSYGTEWVSDNDDDHYHVCSVCGDKTDITDHSYDNGVITTEPTEQATGIKTYTCSECNHTKTDIVPKLDHTHSLATDYSSDATGHWYACSGCDEKVDFESHTEDSGTVTTEPTETTEGVKTFKCVKCEYVMRTEPISPITPEHTHSYGTVWKSDSTSHWRECACGEKTEIAAHISNNGVVTVQPTATSTGLKVYSCSVCGYYLRTETIPATGYNYPIYPTYVPPLFITSSVFTTSPEVEAAVNGSTVTLKWNKVDKAEKYYVYQYKDGKYVKIMTTSDTSVTFKKLKNGETYKYLVRYSINGRRSPISYSGKVAVKVYYKPLPEATSTNNSVKLTWEAVPGAEKYAVYKYVDGKAVKLTETENRAINIRKLSPDTEYKYIVRAYVDGKWTTMLRSDIVTVKTKAE